MVVFFAVMFSNKTKPDGQPRRCLNTIRAEEGKEDKSSRVFQLVDELARAKLRGVEVKVILDYQGSSSFTAGQVNYEPETTTGQTPRLPEITRLHF